MIAKIIFRGFVGTVLSFEMQFMAGDILQAVLDQLPFTTRAIMATNDASLPPIRIRETVIGTPTAMQVIDYLRPMELDGLCEHHKALAQAANAQARILRAALSELHVTPEATVHVITVTPELPDGSIPKAEEVSQA